MFNRKLANDEGEVIQQNPAHLKRNNPEHALWYDSVRGIVANLHHLRVRERDLGLRSSLEEAIRLLEDQHHPMNK